MATFKHISSKNADYGDAEQYLTFEHDEFTMKPTLDKNGQIIPRTGYLISSLNCGDEDFAIACMRSNLKYGKNQKREDVKSHHYIISFDPRDAADNGLSVDRAQQLGEQFCKEHFPGHQALVCTHPDGHNHSGNIHVHIVINSLRIAELSAIFKRLYEDSVAGRISDERFTELSADYEAEQKELKERAAVLQGELSKTLEATANAEKFMKVVRKYTSFEELTPTLLREFVEKIVIHESEALDGKRRGKLRRQEIEIYYSFVGKVELPD